MLDRLRVLGAALSRFTERWVPDSWVICMILTSIALALAISHSVWEMSWRGVITLFGYLAILKGIVRIGFPNVPKNAAMAMIRGNGKWVWIGLVLLLGAWLTWEGFQAS